MNPERIKTVTTTENASTNLLDAAIAREPKLAAIGDKQLQMSIAGLMIGLGFDFNTAESQILGIISNADAHKTAVADRLKTKRAETEKLFTDSFHDLILDAVKSVPTSDLPTHGFSVNVDVSAAYKNSDGSPLMDKDNNPVYGPLVMFDFRWIAPSKAKAGRTGENIGRPVGDYLVEGEPEPYKSMAAIAKAKFDEAEYDTYIKTSGASSRKFLTDKGYLVPDAPITDAEGKAHWVITLAPKSETESAK